VNHEEAKQILLIYRPGTADADDPEVAQALALAQSDPQLSRWFEEHCARQNALREKFRQIPVLAGLKEQIISEEAAKARANSWRDKMVGAGAVAVILVAMAMVAVHFLPGRQPEATAPQAPQNTLANYQNTMLYYAAAGYTMNLLTNDVTQIHAYLGTNQAPADYVLPAGLQKTAVAGCAVENWQNNKVSMICFLTGKPLPQNRQSDLWLFVIDSTAIKDAPTSTSPQFATVDGLMTATWMQDGKVYVLGTAGDEDTIKKYL
jgi:hypothetical protein